MPERGFLFLQMAPLDLQPREPSGLCLFCHVVSPYTKITCDNCGYRLPWADGDADTLGEECPNPSCHTFNVYARTTCRQCAQLLPWHECVAARYHATYDVELEFKKVMWPILAVLFFLVCCLMGFLTLAPRH